MDDAATFLQRMTRLRNLACLPLILTAIKKAEAFVSLKLEENSLIQQVFFIYLNSSNRLQQFQTYVFSYLKC